MKNRKTRAFTIVELVIVIAVIGILAAVLIPTFSGIIKTATISNDEQTAHALTTELRVANPGKYIEDEATLMNLLAKIDPDGTRLSPKSIEYGYQFWFQMDTQAIILATPEDIETRDHAFLNKETAHIDNGVIAVTDVVGEETSGEDNSTATSFRDVFNKGYLLITSDSALGSMFGTGIDNIKDLETYTAYINNLKAKEGDRVYGRIATKLLENLSMTTIRNEHGIFYFANATENFEYFTLGLKVLNANRVVYGVADGEAAPGVPAPKGNKVTLPSSVLLVEEGALNYRTENTVTIQTTLKDAKSIATVFAPASTNSLIKDTAGNTYIVTTGPSGGVLTDGEGNPIPEENYVAVLHTYPTVEGDNPWRADIEKKYAFDELKIGYKPNSSTNVVVTGGVTYVLSAESGKLELYVTDIYGDRLDLDDECWSSTTEGVTIKDGKVVLDPEKVTGDNLVVNITATAKNLNNVEKTANFEFTVVRANQATVKINGQDFRLTDGGEHAITLTYNDANTAYAVTKNGITYSESVNLGSDDVTVSVDANSSSCVKASDGFIKFDITGNKAYTFTVDVDGFLKTTFNVNLVDDSNAAYNLKFRHERSEIRPYYVGSGNTVTIADLFAPKPGETFTGATITIYDTKTNGHLYYNGEINALTTVYDEEADDFVKDEHGNYVMVPADGLTAKYNGSDACFNADSTKVQAVSAGTDTIQFVIDETGSYGTYDPTKYTVTIVLTPADGVARSVEVVVLKGATNVTNINSLKPQNSNDITLSGNIVVHGDQTITSGTTINVGANTLYANGYVFNATSYKAEATGGANEKLNVYSYSQHYVCSCGETTALWNFGELAFHLIIRHTVKATSFETRSEGSAYTPYNTNQAMITVNDGTVDNIYVNGPVYPVLQYYMDDSYSSTTNASTPYYVSGIQANNNSTIKNSYVSGFRQPVQANGVGGTGSNKTTVTINNTTLRGGNYANLDLVSGHLALHNVTTIQDQNGMKNTVAHLTSTDSGYIAEESIAVTGIGIAIEKDALASTKTITGYLNQYNWVKEGQTAQLPTISGIELNSLFDVIFEGVSGTKMSRVLVHYHQSAGGDTYVNAGFVFANMGSSADINALPSPKDPTETSRDLVDEENTFTTGAFSTTTDTNDTRKETGAALAKIVFRLTNLTGNVTVDSAIASVVASKFNNADGQIYIWSYKDGRIWDYDDDTVNETASAKVNVVRLEDGTAHPIHYTGYYDGHGAYSTEYRASATTENIIARPTSSN